MLIPAKRLALQLQLPMQFPPLAQAQEAQEMLVCPFAQLRLGVVLVGGAVGHPQLEDADEFGFRIIELRMRCIRGGAGIGRTLARVLHAQETGNHQHLAQHAMLLRGDQHARELHVDRQLGHGPPGRGQPTLRIHCAQIAQLLPAVRDCTRVWWLQERKLLDDVWTGDHLGFASTLAL